jgi:lipoprotein-anchoring transpeptidase ErfK/SrfK
MRKAQILAAALLVLFTAAHAETESAEAGKKSWVWSKSARLETDLARRIVPYRTAEAPGTIIVETSEYALYLVLARGKALRYRVAVGRDGFSWTGTARIGRRAEWPDWHPPREMVARAAASGDFVPYRLYGGKLNPLGARALYLYQGGRDTLYRIHGTNEPRSIGRDVSSGCIRMLNEDVIDLYDRVSLGAKVIVR